MHACNTTYCISNDEDDHDEMMTDLTWLAVMMVNGMVHCTLAHTSHYLTKATLLTKSR